METVLEGPIHRGETARADDVEVLVAIDAEGIDQPSPTFPLTVDLAPQRLLQPFPHRTGLPSTSNSGRTEHPPAPTAVGSMSGPSSEGTGVAVGVAHGWRSTRWIPSNPEGSVLRDS